MIRVVLADDHPIFRDGLVRSLSDAGDIAVVGEAGDGEEAVELTQSLGPDLVLLDVSMPKGGGLGALARIMEMSDPPPVAMLTASEADEDLMQAVKLGAMGYMLKGVGANELVHLIREISAGRSYVSPGLAGRLLVAMRRRDKAVEASPMDDLSKREDDILKLVAQGLSNREVGEALELQEKTVKHYMTSILQKLHVRNRVEAAMMAREHLAG
jgi:two-component system, NarL family, nitrate/nitrite response regulator NarL